MFPYWYYYIITIHNNIIKVAFNTVLLLPLTDIIPVFDLFFPVFVKTLHWHSLFIPPFSLASKEMFGGSRKQ